MRVGRAILTLRNEKIYYFTGNNPWEKHKQEIISVYRENPGKYCKRIRSIADLAHEKKCDIILFPACTFVIKNKNSYRKYFDTNRLLAAGTLKISGNSITEHAILIDGNEIIDAFDNTIITSCNFKGKTLYAAISSTIAGFYNTGTATINLQEKTKKHSIALDLGHHQYNGRYMLTLKAALRNLKNLHSGNNSVILSFWRFNEGNINSPWLQTDHDYSVRRIFLDDDLLDLIEI